MVRNEVARAKLPSAATQQAVATVVIGNFDDEDSIRAALKGVQSAYLVTPSSARDYGEAFKPASA